MKRLRQKLASPILWERLLYTCMVYIVLFHALMIFSYFLLPEGFLKNKNPLQNWNPSGNALLTSLQIFFYNLISVLMIVIGSLFASKKEKHSYYFSTGYIVFFTLISINAVVLGTWSFSLAGEAVPLLDRIGGIYHLAHRAAVWEMAGQLLITCALANVAVVRTSGKNTVVRKLRDIHVSAAEKLVLVIGFLLMLAGAFVEAVSIHSL